MKTKKEIESIQSWIRECVSTHGADASIVCDPALHVLERGHRFNIDTERQEECVNVYLRHPIVGRIDISEHRTVAQAKEHIAIRCATFA